MSPPRQTRGPALQRWHLTLTGRVQGVGMRPFVYRLATSFQLAGWVQNAGMQAELQVEGHEAHLEDFCAALHQLPPPGRVDRLHRERVPVTGESGFLIVASRSTASSDCLQLPPDLNTCAACLQELFDPCNRRHLYPFISCTACGPRYSFLDALPLDRHNTAMVEFPPCEACLREYSDPGQRRFHAQNIACPDCGPRLEFFRTGERRTGSAFGPTSLEAAVQVLEQGGILAVLGLGGFQLCVDATRTDALATLRARKARPHKPLALMMDSLPTVERYCLVNAYESKLLIAAEGPIVLLRQAHVPPANLPLGPAMPMPPLSPLVAPDQLELGVMLPTTPLHHLLLRRFSRPLVVTSGNRSGEPLCIEAGIDNRSELSLEPHPLTGIADAFLIHNRAIRRPLDDSVARVIDGQTQILRLARGFAPAYFSVPAPEPDQRPAIVLGSGAHLKNSVALAFPEKRPVEARPSRPDAQAPPRVGRHITVVLGPHQGDLQATLARERHLRALEELPALHGVLPALIAHDLHPDYASTLNAQRLGLPIWPVQHHVAHVRACQLEHRLQEPLLGVAWDGSGYGGDGTMHGGEFLSISNGSIRRVGSVRLFPLPGGEAASREGWRVALGMLHVLEGSEALTAPHSSLARRVMAQVSPRDRNNLARLLDRGVQCPRSSSMGRLFDAYASLLDICSHSSHEGEAAMRLEAACGIQAERRPEDAFELPLSLSEQGSFDWGPLLRYSAEALERGIEAAVLARAFHRVLVDWIVLMAGRDAAQAVVLVGGCFQNRRLLEAAIESLRGMGKRPYWSQQMPPNDGSISAGQVYDHILHTQIIIT